MTPRPIALLWCLCSLAGATAGKAATGTVSASPAAPTAAIGSLATTTISWTSAGAATAQVWVSMDGAPESLFTQDVSGSQDAPWIQPGHDYRFQLYAGSQHTVPLAAVDVMGIPLGGGNVTADPRAVDVPKGALGTSVIQWSTQGLANAEVWVSTDGGSEALFARSPAASAPATWIEAGHNYQFRLYAGTAHSQLLHTASVYGDPAYKVGVDYHATGADFSGTTFLSIYDHPEVRTTVRNQLQGMADRGATLLLTCLWMVTSPGVSSSETWQLHFPLSAQEAANLRLYAKDVAAVRAADGHRLRLDLTLLWLGAADYTRGTPSQGLGYDNLSADVFASRVNQTVTSVLNAVQDLTRPDGRRLVDSVYLEAEVTIGAMPNQDWFLITLYPGFVQQVRAAGLTPSLYFWAAASEGEVLDDGYHDQEYPVLNGHRSMFWIYRSLRFLHDQGLPLPQRVDFSCYPAPTSHPYSTFVQRIVQRIFDDADATLPTLGLAQHYGAAETYYLTDPQNRGALGAAFAAQRNVNGRLERVEFWTTPDGGGTGINAAYPFAIEDYLP